MPLLLGGEGDLQHAIYEAVTAGILRLLGADGTERTVTSASEIGVGLSSLRLAVPAIREPESEVVDGPPDPGIEAEPTTAETPTPYAEKELAFSLRARLSSDAARDTLYTFLQELADKVDEGSVSYAEVMLKIRVRADVADALTEVARKTGRT